VQVVGIILDDYQIVQNIPISIFSEFGYLRRSFGAGAPSLRFLQGWGFSDSTLLFSVTQIQNPRPLNTPKGGHPRQTAREFGCSCSIGLQWGNMKCPHCLENFHEQQSAWSIGLGSDADGEWVVTRATRAACAGAPSLRFLQGWGFSGSTLLVSVTQYLNPRPLNTPKGGAPAQRFIRVASTSPTRGRKMW
jgi:hypothetical protein